MNASRAYLHPQLVGIRTELHSSVEPKIVLTYELKYFDAEVQRSLNF